MYSTNRRRHGAAFLAVMQALLLLSAMVLTSAPAIAQDGHHEFVTKADAAKVNPDHPKGRLGDRGFKLRLVPQ